MKIHFLGGVETVTGSQHIIEANGSRVLRDCGLFQGKRKLAREINRKLPFAAGSIHSAVLSHAHIDHCGNLPTLAREGYKESIHATTATVNLCDIMLHDAAFIQEQDAAYLNQKTNRKGLPPVEPLYVTQDAEDALVLMKGHHYGETIEVAPGIQVTFRDAGHILGAALTTFTVEENGKKKRLAYAFDLGRKNLPLIRDPEIVKDIDVLVMESTYGDRYHDDARDAEEDLRKVITKTLERGGKVIIPSFALERAQELIYHIASLITDGKIPQVHTYVDSPMATAVTKVFTKSGDYLDEDTLELAKKMGALLKQPWLHFAESVQESKNITASEKPSIVIAASGMCEHGRILHHLKHGIENPKNTIVIVGFQAGHTLGRRLVEGETKLRIFGDWFERQAEVVILNAFSAHADRTELIEYAEQVHAERTFLVHGEPHQREALAEALKEKKLGEIYVPAQGDVVEL